MDMKVSQEGALAIPPERHEIDALVLSCMDYRLIKHVADYLAGLGLRDNYDQIVLAGSAIGLLTEERSAWGETFWEHVALARELHGIKRVIVIDHRDCGACKAFIRSDCAADRDREMVIQMKWMEELADEIKTRYPDLEVQLVLMDLDGSVEEFDVSQS